MMQILLSPRRLSGIDAARGVALFGMVSTHVLPLYSPDTGTATWAALVFSGRASGLFAVIAGIGIAFLTGGSSPHRGASLTADRRGIAVRALIIGLIGLALGGLETSIALILFHYAALFLVALPFAGLSFRPLAVWAGTWIVLSPVAAYLLRPTMGQAASHPSLGANPTFHDFLDPQVLLTNIFLTGYYPVLQWMSFVLVGMAVGRLDLKRLSVQLGLLGAGLTGAIVAKVVSAQLLDQGGGLQVLLNTPAGQTRPLEAMLDVGLTGIDQSGTWWWLAVSAPHSGTPFDLLHVAGSAMAVIAVCLMLTRKHRNWLLPLSATGAMTLTLYSLHVAVMSVADQQDPLPDPVQLFWIQTVIAVGLGLFFHHMKFRGPLELLISQAARAARETPGGVRDEID